MKILILIILFLIFAKHSYSQEYVPGEVLVKFKKNINTSQKNSKIINVSGTKGKDINNDLTLVKLSIGQSVKSAIDEFAKDDLVEYAEPNYIIKLATTTPNDSLYNNLWGLKNSGQTISSPQYTTNNPGTSGLDMNLENAWDVITDCRSKVVAVIDTGINYNQEDLTNNMWIDSSYPNHGYDFVDTDNDPMDTNGHGTHVAGTIGADVYKRQIHILMEY